MSNFKRTFGNATSPLALSYLDDNFSQLEAAGTSTVTLSGAQLIGYMQSGSGMIAEDMQSRGRWVVYATDAMTTAQRADVKGFTGAVDVSAAVQAAIDYAFTIGAELYFPAGKYNIGTTTLVFKNKVIYRGAGKDNARAKGTIISYTGTSDAIQINNPIDSSTAANIGIRDMWIHCTQRTSGKAAIADVGSTFLSIYNVGVSGNDYGIILDQSELTEIEECDIELTAASSTAGVWLVNGDEHTTGAAVQYTNRISIKKCQFNSSVGGISILDDGGYVHVFEDNNYNGFATHIRSCGGTGVSIRGGQFEAATSTNIIFSNVTTGAVAKGSSIAVELGGGAVIVPAAGQSCISITNLGDITFGKVYFGNTAAAKVASIANCNTCIDTGGIHNAAGGSTFGGNRATRHFEINPSIGLTGTAVIDTNIAINGLSGVTAWAGTAIPAGGTAGSGYKFSSTSNFGVFFGSGAPALAAAKGSLYLRSDGSGTTDRAYINTDGSTTWTALTTAA